MLKKLRDRVYTSILAAFALLFTIAKWSAIVKLALRGYTWLANHVA